MHPALAFTWSSGRELEPLDGYALAMCVRLRGSCYVDGDGITRWKRAGERARVPTRLTEDMIPDILPAFAYMRSRIRRDGFKTKDDVLNMMLSLSQEEVGERWAKRHVQELDRARHDLLVLCRLGFNCLG